MIFTDTATAFLLLFVVSAFIRAVSAFIRVNQLSLPFVPIREISQHYIFGGTALGGALMRFMRIRAAPGTPFGSCRNNASVTYT